MDAALCRRRTAKPVAEDRGFRGDCERQDGARISVEDDDGEDDASTLVLGRGADGEVDEVQTKLDLAQAYMDMEDLEGARGILGEVLAEGNAAQQEVARAMLSKLT